jgi:hypothetical protein
LSETRGHRFKVHPIFIAAILLLSFVPVASVGGRQADTHGLTMAYPVNVTFGTGSAAWGASGFAQGIFVPVENNPFFPLQLTIYATMKSGTAIYVLEGGIALDVGQNETVFLQDYLTSVPVGTYEVTFSAISAPYNQAVSAPTTPVAITT